MQALRNIARAAIIAVLLAGCCHQKRSQAMRAVFVATHPCPSPEGTKTACPGYQVDHIIAICAGGRDAPENMQWLTVAAHKEKTRSDVQTCRHKSAGPHR